MLTKNQIKKMNQKHRFTKKSSVKYVVRLVNSQFDFISFKTRKLFPKIQLFLFSKSYAESTIQKV